MEATGIIEIYTEMTPNPESVKFITNQHILPNFQLDFKPASWHRVPRWQRHCSKYLL